MAQALRQIQIAGLGKAMQQAMQQGYGKTQTAPHPDRPPTLPKGFRMPKFRVISNSETFRIQLKFGWFRAWRNLCQSSSCPYEHKFGKDCRGYGPREYKTSLEAMSRVREIKDELERAKKRSVWKTIAVEE